MMIFSSFKNNNEWFRSIILYIIALEFWRRSTIHGPVRSIRSGPRRSKFEKIKSVPPLAPEGRTPTRQSTVTIRSGTGSGPFQTSKPHTSVLILYRIWYPHLYPYSIVIFHYKQAPQFWNWTKHIFVTSKLYSVAYSYHYSNDFPSIVYKIFFFFQFVEISDHWSL
jgi:hypothetical protein